MDSLANVYVTGLTISSDFPMQNAAQPYSADTYDAFVTKLNPAGSALVYSTYLGGIGWDGGRGIAVDSLGNAYVAGQTGSNNFPTTPGAYQTTHGGNDDAFVAKINASGSLVYSTYLGGTGVEGANAIAVDQSGNAYVTGTNLNGGFPVKDALQTNPNTESFEAFVTKLAPDGKHPRVLHVPGRHGQRPRPRDRRRSPGQRVHRRSHSVAGLPDDSRRVPADQRRSL